MLPSQHRLQCYEFAVPDINNRLKSEAEFVSGKRVAQVLVQRQRVIELIFHVAPKDQDAWPAVRVSRAARSDVSPPKERVCITSVTGIETQPQAARDRDLAQVANDRQGNRCSQSFSRLD